MKRSIGYAALFFLPFVAFAQNEPTFAWTHELLQNVSSIITILLPIVIAIGLLLFFWGLVQFIAKSGSEDAKEEGRRKMIWGVITFFVMISVWGLVSLIGQEFGIGNNNGQSPVLPTINTTS